MSRSNPNLLVFLLILLVGSAGLRAAGPAVDFEEGTFIATGMQDLRTRTLTQDEDGDLFSYQIDGKGLTLAEYFNGKTPYPTMSYPEPQADTDPNTLTKTEVEAGLDQWWADGDGDTPSDEELAEFDEVAGKVLRSRIYTLANPMGKKMLDDDYTPAQVRLAQIYQPSSGDSLNYRGLIFGATAAEAGMTPSRAAQNIRQALGCSHAKAEEYLTTDYGPAQWNFYVQKKAPVAPEDVPVVRGDPTDEDLYRKIECEASSFVPVQNGEINPDLHPGTQDPVEFPEPFDPGASEYDDTTLLEATNMQIYAEFVPGGQAPPLMARGHHYVENYRQVTQADLEFTGSLAGQTTYAQRVVGENLITPVLLPYSDGEGGEATLDLPDGAQVNSAFKAIVEMGEGINGYVRYGTTINGTDVETILYWIPPAKIPGGMTTRWGTVWRGPGLGPISGEEPSVIEELIQDDAGLHWINPPEEMRAWLDPLLFDEVTGQPYRPQVVNSQISEAWQIASPGSKPYGEYSPYAVCNTANGHVMKVDLQFDLTDTSQPQDTGIFRAGDIVLAQNYTQQAPTGLLYKSIQSDLIPEDKIPTDVQGNKIPPNGEGVYLEASTCCGITSIIGGSTVTKNDRARPNAQISAVEENPDEEMAHSFEHKVMVTAGVPNDSRAALDPVGDYHLLYPMTRIHQGIPVLPEVLGDQVSGIQGQDAKFYGDYANDSPVFANAPDHVDYAYQPQTLANPVDSMGFPFMSMHGAPPGDPMYQDFRQGHRYNITVAAWDNLPPLILEPNAQSGIPGYVCYEIRRLDYKVYRLDPSGNPGATEFEGQVIPPGEAANECIQTEPSVEIPWIPHADGAYVWEVEVEDLEGNVRKLVSQVNVTEENIESREIDYESRRGDE